MRAVIPPAAVPVQINSACLHSKPRARRTQLALYFRRPDATRRCILSPLESILPRLAGPPVPTLVPSSSYAVSLPLGRFRPVSLLRTSILCACAHVTLTLNDFSLPHRASLRRRRALVAALPLFLSLFLSVSSAANTRVIRSASSNKKHTKKRKRR